MQLNAFLEPLIAEQPKDMLRYVQCLVFIVFMRKYRVGLLTDSEQQWKLDAYTQKKISHAERTISIRIDIMLNSMHKHTLRLSRAQRATFALPESESRTKTHEVVTLNEVCKHQIPRISSCYRLSRSGSANVARWAREYSDVQQSSDFRMPALRLSHDIATKDQSITLHATFRMLCVRYFFVCIESIPSIY